MSARPAAAALGAAIAAAALALPPALIAQAAAEPAAATPAAPATYEPAAGDALMYIGTYNKAIVIVDEATESVVAEIPLESGIPRSMVLSEDGRRFYVLDASLETLEIVDIPGRQSIGTFTLSRGRERVRIWSYNVDPQERFAILLAKSYTELPDRYEVSAPMLLRYDLTRRAVVDTIPWPGGQEREFVRLRYSPDGELVYLFVANAIQVLRTSDFSQVERWEYGDALDGGMGRFVFGFPEQTYDGPGVHTGLFNVTDPFQDRRFMGIARVQLAEREVEFFTLGPSENVSFVLAPGGQKAFGIQGGVGGWRFWAFDLDSRRVTSRTEFAGRPRMQLMVSSNGEVLYIYNAGETIDLYDATTFRYLRTIDLEADTTTPLFVLPRNAGER